MAVGDDRGAPGDRAGVIVLDAVVRPKWPSEPPRSAGPGGLLQIRGSVVARAMPSGALAQAAWRGGDVLLRAEAETEHDARDALERMRFVLALDDDLAPFHARFRADPLLGRFIRANPRLRVLRKPTPFEALANAICEQLIDTQAAGDIVWALTRALGARHPKGPWIAPPPHALDNQAKLEQAGLAPARARTLARAARAVARGEIDPGAPPSTKDRARLAAIPGIGEWTLAHLDLFGRGVYDVPLERDVGMRNAYARVAGRRTGGVTEDEFKEVLDGYRPYQGLAAMYLVGAGWRSSGRWAQSRHALRRR
jgi:3-methyladenine DNA glycosylase/8-oxoguanine DNA glycosylase